MIGSLRPRRTGAKPAQFLLRLGVLAALAPTWNLARAQNLESEVGFVRALAREMGFIELAKGEAERLAGAFKGAGDQDKVAQLAVEIAYYGARLRGDRAQQRALYKEALDKSKELIERSSDATVQLEARTTLANASQDFGQFLTEELELARQENPDKVKQLEEEAVAVFRDGIDACTKVMDGLKPHIEEKDETRTEYLLTWMRRGVLKREQARAVKTDRNVLVQRAIDDLTEMVLEAGEETAIGLRGLFEVAQCHEVAGEIADAITGYRTAISQIGTSFEQAEKGEFEMSGETKTFLFQMMQEIYVRAGETMLATGAQGTDELFKTFHEATKKYGVKGAELLDAVDDRWGHLMLLVEARYKAESGNATAIGEALQITQQINDRHPNDWVGVKAKTVLRGILEAQSSLVSGKLLFEVAKGEFQNKNYEGAIKGLRPAIAAMSPAEGKQFGLEAWQTLGTAYALTDRLLESILALTEGLKLHGGDDKDRASEAADVLDRAMSQHKRLVKGDAAFDAIYKAAGEEILKYSIGGGAKLLWKAGNDAFNDKNYAEALKQYQQIPPDFLYYELGLVRIAKTQQAMGDHAAARKQLQEFRSYIESHQLEANDSAKKQIRQQALSSAEFAEVQMLYLEARGSKELKIAQDTTKYKPAIEKARTFLTNYGKDDDDLAQVALEFLGRLNSDIGEMAEAETAYTQLKEKNGLRASRLATEIFQTYQQQAKAQIKELDTAIAGDKGEAAIAAARENLRAVRAKLAALGSDYIKNSPKPQLGILVTTMLAYEKLSDWKQVEAIAKVSLDNYGSDKDKETVNVIDLIVRPKVGEALLKQKRFTEAYDMLVAAEKANPTQWELKRQIALAQGGWFSFSSTGRPDPVLGLEKPAEAYQKYYGEYRTWGLRTEVKPYSLDWYRFHWEAFWFAKQAGLKDSKFQEIAAKFYRIARSTDDFATLKRYGEEGLELYNFFQFNK